MPDPDSDLLFDLCFSASSFAVRAALEHMIPALTDRGLPEDQTGNIQIALAEALNNIVEHAYPDPKTTGDIELIGHLSPSTFQVQIQDRGCAMPDGVLPVGAAADLSTQFDDLPEGGFGWFLIRQLTDDLRYEHRDGVNVLTLQFTRSATAMTQGSAA